jgi:undecaprenyl diphosphate synthase
MSIGLPHHIAIIMDGNGRWALRRNLPRIKGHEKGAEAVETAIEGCLKLQVRYLTLYAFSMENWKRPKREVNHLMKYLSNYLDEKLDVMIAKKIRFNAIGRLRMLPDDIQQKITRNMAETRKNEKLTFTLALSYSGRADIVDAAKNIAERVRDNTLQIDDIDEEIISLNLSTHAIPAPDLLIRTSGEKRLSNFLLWETSYSELYFTELLWPDFTIDELEKAVIEFKNRDRRYGRI